MNRLAQTETSDAISTSVTYYNLQIRTKIEHQVSEKATTVSIYIGLNIDRVYH